jgi:thioredoxin-like negative regulator of GroEL
MMDRDVFSTEQFKSLSKKMVFCKVNIDFNPALAAQFGVKAIPNMFVIRPDESIVGSVLGYQSAAEFIPQIENLVNQQ